MPVITQITPQKKKGLFNVFIDGEFVFGLDAEMLVKEKLIEDKTLSEEEVTRLKEVSLYSKLLNNALNFLSFRPRSKKEMSQSLKAKIYKLLGKRDQDLCVKLEKQVISKIESLGYLNDHEFAKWWVEQRTASKNPRGPSLIKKELFSKGVDWKTIEEALKLVRKEDSKNRLVIMLKKKGELLRNKPILEQRRKLYDFLLRRGFSFDVTRTLVDEYLKKA